jgi:hypothetical protein
MSLKSPQSSNSRPLLPPEERFWQRYSPHNEFPLSGLGAITIYLLLGVLIVAGIKLHPLLAPEPGPLPLTTMDDIPEGDDPNASGVGVGVAPVDPAPGVPAVGPAAPITRTLPKPAEGDQPPATIPPDAQRDPLDDYPALARGLTDPAPGGTAPSGKGIPGGNGNGGRPGMPGARPAPQRWNLVFNIHDGEDYRRQLQGLGAILVIPARDGQLLLVRELTPPVRLTPTDGKEIVGIGWRDDRAESVGNLTAALGLTEAPRFFIAFFPPDLEGKLRRLEQDFASRSGRQQGQVKQTQFGVTFNRRTNQYEPVVTDQR